MSLLDPVSSDVAQNEEMNQTRSPNSINKGQQPEEKGSSEWETKINSATGEDVVVNKNTGEAVVEIEGDDGSFLGGLLHSAAHGAETNQVSLLLPGRGGLVSRSS